MLFISVLWVPSFAVNMLGFLTNLPNPGHFLMINNIRKLIIFHIYLTKTTDELFFNAASLFYGDKKSQTVKIVIHLILIFKQWTKNPISVKYAVVFLLQNKVTTSKRYFEYKNLINLGDSKIFTYDKFLNLNERNAFSIMFSV